MEKPSAYVERCCTALERYSALRFTGTSHEGAVQLSGLLEAVMGAHRPVRESVPFDARMRQAGDEA